MQIERLSLQEGAQAATGIAVVIDVFRAFTCEPLLYYYGTSRILLEGDIDRCLAMRGDALLVGETNEIPIPGFDLTNSPFLIMQKGADFFRQRTVIHRTTSGVTGALMALENSTEVLLASFLTARATANYIKSHQPELVSIVAMGIRSQQPAPEDAYCGDYLESLLTGTSYDHVAALKAILSHETAQKFLRGDKPYLPKEDPAICLQRDLFNFALRAQRRGDRVEAVKIDL
ncbi:MAG: 2-phosphosulfolactate phosphatase [Candidatus Competibacteraceae bacterium]